MRDAYLRELYDLAKNDSRIIAMVADNGAIVYDKYRRDMPAQFFNMGISEANMLSVAAGLASCGKIPFAYTISSFLTMRAFEQIRNDVCMQKMNVKLAGIGAGFVYSSLGPTHHATEDIALMRALPNMTVFSPADPMESRKVTAAAAKIDGPVYIRLATGGTPALYEKEYDFEAGRGVTLREGKDITVVSTGNMVLEAMKAADELEKTGVSVRLINIHTIKPIDRKILLKAASETPAILTVEEHAVTGGLGSAVAEVILDDCRKPVKFKRMGLNDSFASGYGSYEDMKEMNGLSRSDIAAAAKELLRK